MRCRMGSMRTSSSSARRCLSARAPRPPLAEHCALPPLPAPPRTPVSPPRPPQENSYKAGKGGRKRAVAQVKRAVAQEKQETLMDQVMEEMVLQALSQDLM